MEGTAVKTLKRLLCALQVHKRRTALAVITLLGKNRVESIHDLVLQRADGFKMLVILEVEASAPGDLVCMAHGHLEPCLNMLLPY